MVGPGNSETLRIPGIKKSRTTLQVPIPHAIDRDGGSFDIELGLLCFLEVCSIFGLLMIWLVGSERGGLLWLHALPLSPWDLC